jgi:nuclear pore complex protein Nup155
MVPFCFCFCGRYRHQYLSNAVLQAKTANVSTGPTRNLTDEGFLSILEDKLIVLGLQMRVRDEFELMTSRSWSVASEQGDASPCSSLTIDAEDVAAKAKELPLNLKSINQLYNDYALPYKLWEVLFIGSFGKFHCILQSQLHMVLQKKKYSPL